MNKYVIYMTLCLLSIGWLLQGCSTEEDQIDPTPEPVEEPTPTPEPATIKPFRNIVLTPQQRDGVKMQNEFAFKLFNEDLKSNSLNSLLSPLSITMCLSMVANGATGEVRNEIVQSFLPTGGNLEELNSLNKYLVESLNDVDNSSKLTLANSVWVDKKFSLLSPFSDSLRDYYDADCNVTDLYSIEGVSKINEWCNNKTNGLIPGLFTNPPMGAISLVNALYFNGQWAFPFKKECSNKRVFCNEDGTKHEVEFMSQTNSFVGGVSSQYSVIKLPYGNEAYSYYAVMPAEGHLLELTGEKWKEIKEWLRYGSVAISMPKYETEYEVVEMQQKMVNAGISKLFNTPGALQHTVSPLITDGVVKIVHKTVFKVDEEGSEGAGLTALEMDTFGPESGGESKITEIILDRPFIYIVEEKSTGAILFIGAIRNL